jgi:hypothetical protein
LTIPASPRWRRTRPKQHELRRRLPAPKRLAQLLGEWRLKINRCAASQVSPASALRHQRVSASR